MKVKAVQFVPLGRPPKGGEWGMYKHGKGPDAVFFQAGSAFGDSYEAYERREVEVDVPDPVPEWIDVAVEQLAPALFSSAKDAWKAGLAIRHRSHVERCAKAAGEEMTRVLDRTGDLSFLRRIEIIREAFL